MFQLSPVLKGKMHSTSKKFSLIIFYSPFLNWTLSWSILFSHSENWGNFSYSYIKVISCYQIYMAWVYACPFGYVYLYLAPMLSLRKVSHFANSSKNGLWLSILMVFLLEFLIFYRKPYLFIYLYQIAVYKYTSWPLVIHNLLIILQS